MRNDLTRMLAVIHPEIYAVGVEPVFHSEGDDASRFGDRGPIFRRDVKNIFGMHFWNYKRVSRIDGPDVEEGEDLVILVYLVCRQLSADYFAKKALIHMIVV